MYYFLDVLNGFTLFTMLPMVSSFFITFLNKFPVCFKFCIHFFSDNFIDALVYNQVSTSPDRANNLEPSSESAAHEFISTVDMIMAKLSCSF